MDLSMDPGPGAGYRSRSQAARRITEAWAISNLYCLSCSSESLTPAPANTAVLDFTCPTCDSTYQLKGKGGRFGSKASNSAYGPKMLAIAEGRAPHYAFLEYDSAHWQVTGLFVVPAHFMSPSIIQERPPLLDTARRAGWVGSNILLGRLPEEGKVRLVSQSNVREAALARRDWRRFEFLSSDRRAGGGWGADMLACVHTLRRETGSPEFTLQEFYSRFTDELSALYPTNLHIQDKIRQQLQVLRDGDVIKFLGRGTYRTIT